MSFIKIPTFFIKDLLKATLRNDNFFYKNVTFTDVIVYGVIIDYNSIVDNESQKQIWMFEIEDGTATVTCLLEQHNKERDINKVSIFNTKTETVDFDFDDSLTLDEKYTIRMTESLTGDNMERESFRLLRKGHDVCVHGILQVNNGINYVYIKKIELIVSLDQKIDNLKEVVGFYHYLENCEM